MDAKDTATLPRGLDEDEVRERLRRHGPNRLPSMPRRRLGRVVLDVLREPMFLLLVAASGLYLALGDPAEGLLLALFAGLSVGLVVVQQQRSERALDALRALASPVARVRRAGQTITVPAAGVVPGDWILLDEGERVPADALLRRGGGLRIDESLLTGESVPVAKQALAAEGSLGQPGGDGSAGVFAGTLVVAGHGIAEVVRTGADTAAGRIGASLATIVVERTLLQRSLGKLVQLLGLMAGVVSLAVLLLYGLQRGEWLEGALAAIAVAMALLPEEFPMAFAVFVALGAWRLAQLHILTRRPAVIETLGAASVLCVDKTGTLTENRMQLRTLAGGGQAVWIDDRPPVLDDGLRGILWHALLASRREGFDPMDQALQRSGEQLLAEHAQAPSSSVRQYGLSPDLLAYSQAWRQSDGRHVIATKGAPEAVARLCGLDADSTQALLREVEGIAARGLRVLAVAHTVPLEVLPAHPSQARFRLDGLVGFDDPLRAGAAAAITLARSAGIRVVMITGDYPVTALAIANAAGIDTTGGCLAGSEIDALDDAALEGALPAVSVFARIRPEQKLRLVDAFKRRGEVVAMTGDGVNDAPALKAAHIGIAMARGGTDVAREAAAISLLEDDIAHIVDGVRMGRRIFDNLRKVLIYIVAIHVPVAGLALLPILWGWPPLLLPMHVVLIEMVVDPICALAFEGERGEPDLMDRPPRKPSQPLLGLHQLAIATLQGLLLLLGVLGLHQCAVASGLAHDAARTVAFVALTAGNFALVRVNGSRGATLPRLFEPGHQAYWWVVLLASGIVAACIAIPMFAGLFGFAPVDGPWIAAALAVGLLSVGSFELLKPLPGIRRALGG